MSLFSKQYLEESVQVLNKLDPEQIDKLATELAAVREGGGRLFIIGNGGSAGHATHAVNDFRKLCAFEAYCPTDNVSEFTARANDEGLDTTFTGWLKVSRLNTKDALLIFSVGGGSKERNVSMNIVNAIDLANEHHAKVFGIVGRDGGYTKAKGTTSVVIPTINDSHVTPHVEGFCALVWHLLVSHPALKVNATKW